jgi:hypothetical protein
MQARGSLRCHFHYHNRIVKDRTRGHQGHKPRCQIDRGRASPAAFRSLRGSTTPVDLPGISLLSPAVYPLSPTGETPNLAKLQFSVNDLLDPKPRFFRFFSGGLNSPHNHGSKPRVSQLYRPLRTRQATQKFFLARRVGLVWRQSNRPLNYGQRPGTVHQRSGRSVFQGGTARTGGDSCLPFRVRLV